MLVMTVMHVVQLSAAMCHFIATVLVVTDGSVMICHITLKCYVNVRLVKWVLLSY